MPVERLLEAEIAVDPASFPSNHTSGGGPSGSGFLSGQSHGVNAGDQVCLTFPACVVQNSSGASHQSRSTQTPNRMELWRYADFEFEHLDLLHHDLYKCVDQCILYLTYKMMRQECKPQTESWSVITCRYYEDLRSQVKLTILT